MLGTVNKPKWILFAFLVLSVLVSPQVANAGSMRVPGNSYTGGGFVATTESYAHWASGSMTTSSTLRLNTEAAEGGLKVSNTMIRGIYTGNDARQTKQIVNGIRTRTLSCAQSYTLTPSDSQYGWHLLQSTGTAWMNVSGGVTIYMGIASTGNNRSHTLEKAIQTGLMYEDGGKYLRVVGVNGITGFIETEEANRLMNIGNEEEALHYAREHEGTNYLSVYDSNKTTVVDVYPLVIEIAE